MRARTRSQPTVVSLLVIAIFLPEALSFTVFDLRLTLARLVPLALSPALVVGLSSLITSRRYRFVASDILIPLAGLWMILAPAMIEGLPSALKSAGILALEFVGPYLVIRCLVHTVEAVHGVVKLFCMTSAIVGPLGLFDTIAGHPLIHDDLARLTGYSYAPGFIVHDPADMYRLGLFRAQGVFEHPILFGVAMCYALMLAGTLYGWRRIFCLIGCIFGLFLSLSSAPWIATALGSACLIYRWVAQAIPCRWLLAVGGGVLAAALIFTFSRNPFGLIFNYLTLDSFSAYFRLLIWKYAGWDLLRSPFFGIGITTPWARPDWMPSSVDSLWLRAAMIYGIPGSAMIGLSLIASSWRAVYVTPRNSAFIGRREVLLAESLGIITFLTIFLGFTVFYWGACSLIVSLLVGLRATLGQIASE